MSTTFNTLTKALARNSNNNYEINSNKVV